MNPIITIVLIVSYLAGARKFWKGFGNTNFSPGANRTVLSLLWPVLFVTNKSYRQNFKRALKG